jgi:N-acetylglucosamine-6-phosphate deacetylase
LPTWSGVERRSIELAFRAAGGSGSFWLTDAVAWRAGSVGEGRNGIRIGSATVLGARLDGTLAGSAVTMDQDVRNVVDVCGIPLEVQSNAAPTNPAPDGCTDRGDRRRQTPTWLPSMWIWLSLGSGSRRSVR